METDLRCFREVLSEVKKARSQPNLDFFFFKRMIHSLQLLHLKFLHENFENMKYCLNIEFCTYLDV
jgi:hypothetical protein